MKHQRAKRFTAFLLSGALLTTGYLSAMPALAASTDKVLTTTIDGLEYRYIVNKDSTSCTLMRISDKDGDGTLTTTQTLTIPDKIPGTNYVIKELGYQNQAIIHSNNASKKRLTTLTLPKQVEYINQNALWYTEVPVLTHLYVNLNKLKHCSQEAFSENTNLANIYVYDAALSTYVLANTVEDFEKYFGLIYQYDQNGNKIYDANGNPKPTEYKTVTQDHPKYRFQLKDSNLTGKLTFLNAVCRSRYGKQLGYQYAINIAKENKFTATNITKQEKLEMIYNYITSHVRYSAFNDSLGNGMGYLSNSLIAPLAMNSGVCGAHAAAFEALCRASGFKVETDPEKSEVVCVSNPGHSVNAVRLSQSEGYYIVDCTYYDVNDRRPVFMDATFYKNTQFEYMYSYTRNFKQSQIESTRKKFDTAKLSNNRFQSCNSYFRIENKVVDGPKVEVYNANKPSCKYISYTSHRTPSVGGTCNVSRVAYHDVISQFISSNSYFVIKIGDQVIQQNTNPQPITVDGKKYMVRFAVKNFDSTQPQVCSNSNYYYLSITRTN